MKTSSLILVSLLSMAVGAAAQTASLPGNSGPTTGTLPTPTAYQIVEQGPHHNVWQQQTYTARPNGQVVTNVESYTELATGLNHLVNGQWVASREEIDILPDGSAAATNGQHQAYFPGDIYTGEIRMVTPDGLVLQSRPIGMSYDDGTNTVMIAELTNSIGYLASPNQVIYPNAFTGFNADLRYTYKKGGFEQDIILHQQPPTPESLDLNPDTARLQVLTEFFSPPQPAIQSTTLPVQAGLALTDQALGFGTMTMAPGRAFLLGTNAINSGGLVAKSWVQLDNRQFLVEEVPVDAIVAELAALPLAAINSSSGRNSHLATSHLNLPPRQLAKNDAQPVLLVKAKAPASGFVLDYLILNGSYTNYTFQGNATYYISGDLNLYGTTTIEGGAVLKYTNNAYLFPWGVVDCETSPYRPAVFTAKDDNAVGRKITGSTGNPAGYYANPALLFSGANTGFDLHDLRFSYSYQGVQSEWNNYAFTNTISDCQFIDDSQAVYFYDLYEFPTLIMQNVLAYQVQNGAFNCYGDPFSAQYCTVDQANNILSSGSNAVVQIANSLFVNVTNPGSSFTSVNNATNNSGGVFQVVGGGAHYLATNSPYRGQGSTNIDPVLLAQLRQKTTWPPMLYSNVVVSTNLTLNPQAPRDTNANLDLGYHYDPIDYLCGEMYVTNATLTVNPGTVIGCFGLASTECSFSLNGSGRFLCQGDATDFVRIVEYATVQEGYPNTNWCSDSSGTGPNYWAVVDDLYGTSNTAAINCQYTYWSCLEDDAQFMILSESTSSSHLSDCELYSATVVVDGPILNITNCLIVRGNIVTEPINPIVAQNNLFYKSYYEFLAQANGYRGPRPATNSIIRNNAFDQSPSTVEVPQYINVGFNAYVLSTNYDNTYSFGDMIMTNPIAYQIGPLGDFYQPSNSPLINMGSTNANLLGLYHFTTQTNQVPEGTNIVSIGYHYVATDQYGNPLDSNGDGIPDYIEDANGDGLNDDGETPWSMAIVTQPASQTVLQDGDAVLNVVVDGVMPLNYQWRFNGTNLVAQTNATLTITSVQPANAGTYSVAITNIGGSLTSSNAVLSVTPVDCYLTVASGASQNWVDYSPGQPVPLSVIVSDTNGNPLTNVPLTFSVTNGLAQLALNPVGTTAGVQTTMSGTYGLGTAYFTLPYDSFGNTNVITVTAPSGTNTVEYTFMESTLTRPMLAAGVDNYSFFIIQTPLGNVFTMGDDNPFTVNSGSNVPFAIGVSNVIQVAAGANFGLALDDADNVWAFGDNSVGELGNTNADYFEYTPVQPEGLSNVLMIAAGDDNAGVVESDGTVWVWGGPPPMGGDSIVFGPDFVGGGFHNDNSTPAQVPGITNAVALSLGDNHALVLASNGTVISWGDNYSGQLGNGTYTDDYTPTTIPGLSNIVQVVAGSDFSLALQTNGVVWAWGDNDSGQLGTGDTNSLNPSPVAISFPTNIVQIAAGYAHALAFGADGTLWAWGDNYFGELGNTNAVGGTNQPVPVAIATNLISITAGSGSSFALDANENIWSWGEASTLNDLNLTQTPLVATNYPIVSIVSPTNAQVFGSSNNLAIQVDAQDAYGIAVQTVNFYFNGIFIGSSTNAPFFTFTCDSLPAYDGYLQAQGIDSNGFIGGLSSPVYVMVQLVSNGYGLPDSVLIGEDNDPLNPWVPPAPDPDDHTPPSITLTQPANATLLP